MLRGVREFTRGSYGYEGTDVLSWEGLPRPIIGSFNIYDDVYINAGVLNQGPEAP